MTIDWGSYSVVSGTGLRVGIQDEGQSAVNNGSSTCVQSFTDWSNPGGAGASGSNYNGDNCTVSQSTTGGSLDTTSFSSVVDGSADGSSGPTTEQHGGTHTVTWTYSDYGATHSVDVTIGITGLFNGSTPTKTKTFTFPARPYSTPSAPTSPTATRVNDGQVDLAWTNNSTASGLYQSIKVYRSTDGGGYSLVATLGVVTSYSDVTVSANHKYTYKIEAVNTTGATQSAATSAIWTTPGAPSSLTAAKITGGNIRLTWTNNVNYSEYTVRIEESQNGGAYSEIASVSTGVATWDHVAPSTSVTHKYRVRARTSSGTTLNSAYSNESDTIVLLSTAAAPTNLAPNGPARDATEATVLTWTHNPTDGTPQSKYQLQYKVDAGSYTTVGPTTSGVSSYTLPAATVTNNHTITWHVATAGENGTIGAYSADATWLTRDRPTGTISFPSSTFNNSKLTASWTFFQAQSATQTAWHIYLWKKGAQSDFSDATLIEEATGSGTGTSYLFAATLLDGATYGVRVYVTSSDGLTSVDAGSPRQEFTVAYLPPADATLTLAYVANVGRVNVTIQGTGATASVQGLVLDGTGDWGTCADAAALDVTGDLDLRADMKANDWTPATHTGIIEKWDASTQCSYALTLDTAGKLRMRITTGGTTGTLAEAISSVAVGASDGSRLSVRAARVGTTVTFYTSTDNDISIATWTQLGTTQTLSGTIFAGTAVLRVGSDGAGAALAGTIFSAMVKGASGTTVAYPIYRTQSAGTTSFSDGFSNTWTLVGNASIQTITPGTVAIDTVDLQRQINGGAWVTWVVGVVLNAGTLQAIITDTAPTINGTNNYRAVIRSTTPSSKLSPEVAISPAETQWGFLSTGNGFSTLVRMRALLARQAGVGRSKETYHFAGREKPVELSGEETTLALRVSATLYPPSFGGQSSEPEELESFAKTTMIVLWRDYRGRRVFGSLSGVDVAYDAQANKFPVNFVVTEIDYNENVG